MRRLIIVLVCTALAAFAVATVGRAISHGPSVDMTRLLYLMLMLTLVGGGMAFVGGRRFGSASTALRNAAIWLVILFAIMGLYGLKREIADALYPSAPRAAGADVELRRGADGHFWAEVQLNGVATRMIVDTGASDVALTPRDARRLGLDPAALAYTIRVSTAQGESVAAPITLDQVRLGSITLDHVSAEVMREESGASLLGMSFLNRLDGYEARRDTLALHPPR